MQAIPISSNFCDPHLHIWGGGDSELMVVDLQKVGMALVDAVKQTMIWLLRSSEKLVAAGSAAAATISLVMLARVRATLLLLAASKVLDTPNKVQPHPIRPSKKWSFAVSSSRMVSIQPKPATCRPGFRPHLDSDSTGDSHEMNMKMPRKVLPPPTIAIKMMERGGGGRRG
ncbi:MAG: hypothetical protein NXY57DRAFT_1043999 [Lentinula lateritia]|nr:MAG: hypothetical protein NXY57DRAFT_1043999 [Lentinula lateritia]